MYYSFKVCKELFRNCKASMNLKFPIVKLKYLDLLFGITLIFLSLYFPIFVMIKFASNPFRLWITTGIKNKSVKCNYCKLFHGLHQFRNRDQLPCDCFFTEGLFANVASCSQFIIKFVIFSELYGFNVFQNLLYFFLFFE